MVMTIEVLGSRVIGPLFGATDFELLLQAGDPSSGASYVRGSSSSSLRVTSSGAPSSPMQTRCGEGLRLSWTIDGSGSV